VLETIDLNVICKIVKKAAIEIMKIYQKDFLVEYKEDNSPLTEADLKANSIICEELQKLYPNIPILSEENTNADYEIRKNWEYYWCIDPIDGTKEFIKKNDEFTINIGLIYKEVPVLGVVYAPALELLYYAKKAQGAYKNGEKLPLYKNKNLKEKLVIATSKSHQNSETKKYIDSLQANKKTLLVKGSSLKLCLVAEGVADIYPRLSPTMEWDTAAADAIVRISGKMTYQLDTNKPLIYNKETLLNPWFVVK